MSTYQFSKAQSIHSISLLVFISKHIFTSIEDILLFDKYGQLLSVIWST